jgi:hypothetical protein
VFCFASPPLGPWIMLRSTFFILPFHFIVVVFFMLGFYLFTFFSLNMICFCVSSSFFWCLLGLLQGAVALVITVPLDTDDYAQYNFNGQTISVSLDVRSTFAQIKEALAPQLGMM